MYVFVVYIGRNVCMCFYALCVSDGQTAHMQGHWKAPLTWADLDTPDHQGAACEEHHYMKEESGKYQCETDLPLLSSKSIKIIAHW